MRADRATRRKIAAGRREDRATAPREQRTEEQHRTTQPTDQRGIGFVLGDVRAPHAKRRRAQPLDVCAEIDEQLRHDLDVLDARDVGQHALVARQQTGREQWQRGVLVALDFDDTREPPPAFNQ